MQSFMLFIARFIRALFGLEKPIVKEFYQRGIKCGKHAQIEESTSTRQRIKYMEEALKLQKPVYFISNAVANPIIGFLIDIKIDGKGIVFVVQDYITNEKKYLLSVHYLTNCLLEALLACDYRTRFMIYYNHHHMSSARMYVPSGDSIENLLSSSTIRKRLTDNLFFDKIRKDKNIANFYFDF